MEGKRVHKNKNKIQSLLIKKAQSNLEDGSFSYYTGSANGDYEHSATRMLWERAEGALSPMMG